VIEAMNEQLVNFSEVLKDLGVEIPEIEAPTTPPPPETPEISKLQEIYNQINSMTLPNHQKYSILASIECTIESLTINPQFITKNYKEIQSMVQSKFPIKVECLDQNYYTVSKDTMAKFLSATMSSKLKYLNDRFDCDNFASYVSSFMALEYGINTVGECFVGLVAYGEFFVKVLGLHACNMVVLPIDVQLYEPQLNRFLQGNTLPLKDKQGRTVNIYYLPMQVVFG